MQGGDARLGVLLFQYTSAPTLIHNEWCKSDRFTGSPSDAKRVLRDIAKVLKRLESKGVRHNCVTPKDIFYSQQTGALLATLVPPRPMVTSHSKTYGLVIFLQSVSRRGKKGSQMCGP